ncbi:MAG TPA: hypothetical protein PLU50_09760, partial [Pseudobdellovibrionaceae bacterium]|nr:hypothetical protein [Pseudobdellovibrionaceae bacterium]
PEQIRSLPMELIETVAEIAVQKILTHPKIRIEKTMFLQCIFVSAEAKYSCSVLHHYKRCLD